MALLFCDSFDSTAAFSDIVDRWDAGISGAAGFSLTGGRTGGPCLEQQTALAPPAKYLTPGLCRPGSGVSLYVSSSVRLPTYPASGAFRGMWNFTNERSTPFAADINNRTLTATTLSLDVNSSGNLRLARNNVALATGTLVLPLTTWQRVEVRVANIDDTGGIFEVRVNGVVDISLTNADLWLAGPKEIVGVIANCTACRHDDVLMLDSTGTTFNDFLGDLVIETLRPNGVGATTQSTPNTGTAWQAVDEVASDFDTTYTAITTVDNLDTYAYANMAATPATIHGVVVTTQAASPGMTPRKFKALSKLASTTDQGPEHNVLLDLTSAYRMEQAVFPTKPGGGAWTKTDVDAAEFGWQVTQ